MILKTLHILCFLSFTIFIQAQTDTINTHMRVNWDKLSITGSYQNGYVYPTNVFVKGINVNSTIIEDYQAFSLKLSTQTTGDRLWEQLCKAPTLGVCLYTADFFNAKEIGYPFALYGFLNAPFFRLNRFSLNYELGFGATFNWRSFNPLTNQYNVAIGAGETFMSDAGLNLNYELTNHIDFIVGASFSHFSNGALKLPNFGFNTLGPKVSLKYNFYERPKFTKQVIPKFNPRNEWLVSTFVGIKNIIFDSAQINIIEKYEGVFFPVFGISTTFNRQIGYRSKFGIGMTLTYNSSINAQIAVDNNELSYVDGPISDKIQLSIYPSYELVTDKISFILQPAFYIYRKKTKNQSPVFHQRIGLQYHVTDDLFVGIALRDFSLHADFIEWTFGYRINGKAYRKHDNINN